jgi:hypothetical protein
MRSHFVTVTEVTLKQQESAEAIIREYGMPESGRVNRFVRVKSKDSGISLKGAVSKEKQ